jgi:hypothetical protein
MMATIDSERNKLNKQVTKLRRVMSDPARFDEARQLFRQVHAQLHSASISDGSLWSFADAVLDDLDEATFRRIPKNQEHSIAWCLWHIARIEDMTMNILVADEQQIYRRDGWEKRLGAPCHDTGNAMDVEAVVELSQALNLADLRAYRQAVGQNTRQIVAALSAGNLREEVVPSRLQRVWDEGGLVKAAQGVADYWGGRDTAGLLLMPASRHCLTHLNEALKLKHRRA